MEDPGNHESHDPSFDGLLCDPSSLSDISQLFNEDQLAAFLALNSDGTNLDISATSEITGVSPKHAESRPAVAAAQVAGHAAPAGYANHTSQNWDVGPEVPQQLPSGLLVGGRFGGVNAPSSFTAPSGRLLARPQLPPPNSLPSASPNPMAWGPSTMVAGTPVASENAMGSVREQMPNFRFGQTLEMEYGSSGPAFAPALSHVAPFPPQPISADGHETLAVSAARNDGFFSSLNFETAFPGSSEVVWPESGSGLSSADVKASPPAELLAGYDSSPTLAPVRRRQNPTASPDVNAPPRAPPNPHAQKSASSSLEFIPWDPNSCANENISKKRRAQDDGTNLGSATRTLRKISYEGENGEVHGALITLGNPEHHRSSFTPERREETRLARKEGVCRRCQESKRKCDLALKPGLYEPCTRCSSSRLYKGAFRMPCFKSNLQNILFFRDGPAENEPMFTVRVKGLATDDISKPNVPVRDLRLTQNIAGHVLTVYASEFTPLPNDKVSLKWKDTRGNTRETKMPPFCLTNMQKVTAQIKQYIYVAKDAYLEALKKEDELVSMTVAMAMDYSRSKTGSLVGMALDLWAISRMIEIEWEICGRNTLGISRISDPTNPRNGKIPIPPIMDTQLDQIIITQVLQPLKRQLLARFEEMISPARREDWFEIYLTAFIILNHVERLAEHSANHAKLHSMSSQFSNVPFLERSFHAAKVVLSRFHFICNGSKPLSLDWGSESTLALAKVEPDQAQFMKNTQALIKARENEVMSLRTTHSYGRPLYWSAQLFTEDWDNSPAQVVLGVV